MYVLLRRGCVGLSYLDIVNNKTATLSDLARTYRLEDKDFFLYVKTFHLPFGLLILLWQQNQ